MKRGIDTNVLIRYLIEDDPDQAQRAKDNLTNCNTENPCFITLVVLCELVWMLRRTYKFEKRKLIETLDRLINNTGLEIQERECVLNAFENYKNRDIGFVDCLIGVLAQKYGYEKTMTFDSQAGKYDDFELI